MHRALRYLRSRSIGTLMTGAGAGLATSRATTIVTVEDDARFESARKEKPDHWVNEQGTKFVNPWPSFRDVGVRDIASMLYAVQANAPSAAELKKAADEHIPQMKPTFGTGAAVKSDSFVKVTFLGHACFLLEYPPDSDRPGSRGVTILLDPVFSDRCSPSKWVGPLRYTKAPCAISDIPEVSAVLISHAHYDHLDVETLSELARNSKHKPQLFLPLNTKRSLSAELQRSYDVHEMDWWDSCRMLVPEVGSVQITCTPAQHNTGRGLFDKNASLWASWAIEGMQKGTGGTSMKVWFGGDTGYCAVEDGDHELRTNKPHCPAFKEIGDRFGFFDLGLIPIGAYDPRGFMSPFHCAPIDSVRIFQDTKCRTAIGAHWGAWRLTSEPVDEPPKRLAAAREMLNIPAQDFGVMAIGETRIFERKSEASPDDLKPLQ